MKRFVLLSVLLCIVEYVLAVEPTPRAVNTFYAGMQRLQSAGADEAADIKREMQACFYASDINGINLPNDFRHFDADRNSISHDDDSLQASTYVIKLIQYINRDRNMQVKCNVMGNNKVGMLPDFREGKATWSDACVISYVDKTYSLGSVSKQFLDTVWTWIPTGKISRLINGNSVKPNTRSIESMMIDAALAYGRKDYEKAYNIFDEIHKIDKENLEACYYLGLMTYWQQGCKKRFGKRHKQVAKEYMQLVLKSYSPHRSIFDVNYNIREKARQVLDLWNNPDQIF